MPLKKKILLEMIKETKDMLDTTVRLGKEEHDCAYSIVMLRFEGKLEILNEILDKYYNKKRIENRKRRITKTIEMINSQIKRKERKQTRKYQRAIATRKSYDINKDIDERTKIRELKKRLEAYQKEYMLKYGDK